MGYTYFIKAFFVCHRLLPYIWWMEIAKCHDSRRTYEIHMRVTVIQMESIGISTLSSTTPPIPNPTHTVQCVCVCVTCENRVGELWGVGQMRKLKDINRIGAVWRQRCTQSRNYIFSPHTLAGNIHICICNAEKSSCVWHRIYGKNSHSSMP